MSRLRRLVLCACTVVTSATTALVGLPSPSHSTQFTLGQSRYYEYCAGCHGLGGTSERTQIPVLRAEVGRFLCTADGRRYIVRLPNVSFTAMDDQDLAETMNFVVFTLGAESVPGGVPRYTAREVAQLRKVPLKATDLLAMRREILAKPGKSCPV